MHHMSKGYLAGTRREGLASVAMVADPQQLGPASMRKDLVAVLQMGVGL